VLEARWLHVGHVLCWESILARSRSRRPTDLVTAQVRVDGSPLRSHSSRFPQVGLGTPTLWPGGA
jgi:hypothetical protein